MSAAVASKPVNAASAASVSSLESFKRNRNVTRLDRKKGCGRRSLHGADRRIREDHFAEDVFVTLACKSWNCAFCAQRKKQKLQVAIERESETAGLNRLLSLTLDPRATLQTMTFEEFAELPFSDERKQNEIRNAVAVICDSYNKLRVALGRKYGQDFQYIRILELQHNGMPHLHLLVSEYIPVEWLRARWTAAGGGAQVNIKRIPRGQAARYVAKYLAKDLAVILPSKCRRVTCSRKIKMNRSVEGPEYRRWQMKETEMPMLLEFAFRFGSPVTIVDMQMNGDELIAFGAQLFRTQPEQIE